MLGTGNHMQVSLNNIFLGHVTPPTVLEEQLLNIPEMVLDVEIMILRRLRVGPWLGPFELIDPLTRARHQGCRLRSWASLRRKKNRLLMSDVLVQYTWQGLPQPPPQFHSRVRSPDA